LPAAAGDLEIDDRVDSFEKFHAEATRAKLSSKDRFALWLKDGGAVGEAKTRSQLDKAWPRYAELMPVLPSLARAGEDAARTMFDADLAALGAADTPLHSRLVLYVGQFDDIAFSVPPRGDKPATTFVPVANSSVYRRVLAHELAHGIHFQLAGVTNVSDAPIGETMFLEGLAMRTAQRADPGHAETDYAAMPPDARWMTRCAANKDRIIRRILPDLDKTGRRVTAKYTIGKGNTGLQREVYCAAWFAFDTLFDQGHTLPKLARIPEEKMVETMRAALTIRR